MSEKLHTIKLSSEDVLYIWGLLVSQVKHNSLARDRAARLSEYIDRTISPDIETDEAGAILNKLTLEATPRDEFPEVIDE